MNLSDFSDFSMITLLYTLIGVASESPSGVLDGVKIPCNQKIRNWIFRNHQLRNWVIS